MQKNNGPRKKAAAKAAGKKNETVIIRELVKEIKRYVKTLPQDNRERFKKKLIGFLNKLAKETEKL
jgi:hypothetical protein